MYRIIEPDAAQWGDYVNNHPRAHVLQLPAWGALKAAYGWQVVRVGLAALQGNELVAGAQLLLRPLGRVGKLAYLPMGPLVSAEDQWAALWPAPAPPRRPAARLHAQVGTGPRDAADGAATR